MLNLDHGSFFWDAALSPDGRRVITASDDKTARVWDTATGEPTSPALPHADPVTMAKWSPNGKRMITVSKTEAKLWDASTGQARLGSLEARRQDHVGFLQSGRTTGGHGLRGQYGPGVGR